MITHFSETLENLRSKLLLMGQLSIDSLRLSMEALVERDHEIASRVKSKDKEIDLLENLDLVNP